MIIGLCAFPAFGQDEPAAPAGEQPREARRTERPNGERGERGMGRGDRGGQRMIERLAEELQLDDSQQAQFDDIMTAHRERMRAMGEKRRAMREATEAGDDEAATKLRAEMEESGGFQGSMEQAMDELEPVLREDQVEKLDQLREQQRQRDGGREEYQRVVRELPDALKLDEAQRTEFEGLVQTRREEMRERFAEMRPLFEEIRTAREAGDEARVAELMKEMEAKRPSRDALVGEFLTAVDGILREDQKALLVTYREQLDANAASGVRGTDAASLRSLFRAASKLDLNDEQRDQLKEIQRDTTTRLREVGRRDKEGQAMVIASAKERIVGLLDQTQAAAFEETLSKASRRGR